MINHQISGYPILRQTPVATPAKDKKHSDKLHLYLVGLVYTYNIYIYIIHYIYTY